MVTFHHADAVAWANNYQGAPFMALFCDAPYEIGFMSKGWDASGVAFDPETWKAFARILYPGAYLFVFAGTLNDDLISLAMRQAGLRKHHKMLSWGYGSGFPKATRVKGSKHFDVHRYGGQALKPSLEPILIFQKPYAGKPAESIVATGAGALNVDGARIGGDIIITRNTPGQNKFKHLFSGDMISGRGNSEHTGRWPANLLLSHAPDCNGVCVPDCPIEQLGQQSGERPNGYRINPSTNASWFGKQDGNHIEGERGHDDAGTAARYFFQSDYLAERLEHEHALAYFAKASSAEREAGLDPLQTRIMREFYGLDDFDRTTVDDGRQKSIDNPYQRGETERRNTHPTIKPIALTRYLSTLLLPPDTYGPRRLFIPFAGVASECIGAMLAGWEHVEGVELDETHCRIAAARLAYWEQMRGKFDQGQPIKVKTTKDQSDQLHLF